MENTANKFEYGLNIFFGEKELAVPLAKKGLPEISGPAEVSVLPGDAGVSVHVNKDSGHNEPVRILLRGSTKIAIAVDPGVRVTFIEEGNAEIFSLDIVAADGADVRYLSRRAGGAEMSARRAIIGKDAKMVWVNAQLGARFGYIRTLTDLVGAGAGVKDRSLFLGARADRFDLYSEVRHMADATSSDLLTRGVLGGKSKAIVRGLVKIKEGTHACIGRQKEDTLLVSPTAKVDAVPMLEIAAFDVRCSHSASAGRLDDGKLFYLMSRGLSREDATRSLVEGFFAPVLVEYDKITAAGILGHLFSI